MRVHVGGVTCTCHTSAVSVALQGQLEPAEAVIRRPIELQLLVLFCESIVSFFRVLHEVRNTQGLIWGVFSLQEKKLRGPSA